MQTDGTQSQALISPTGETAAHYRLAPSNSKRWLACPGSAQSDLPDEPNVWAKVGTIAHKAAETHLESDSDFNPLLLLESQVYDAALPLVGNKAAGEIAYCASFYVEVIDSHCSWGERRHELKIAHKSIPEFGGTIDTAVFNKTTLGIVDLKTGTWPVDVPNNPQLMSYLALARQEIGTRQGYGTMIVQPRTKQGRRWAVQQFSYSNYELDAFEDKVRKAGQSDELVPGEHCRFCPLRPTCEPGTKYASTQPRWK